MMYNSYICSLILTEKSAVYDEGLPLLLLDDMSSISTLSIIIVPINDIPARYMRKRTSQERKTFFTSFARRQKGGGCLGQFCRACSTLLQSSEEDIEKNSEKMMSSIAIPSNFLSLITAVNLFLCVIKISSSFQSLTTTVGEFCFSQ